MYIICNKLMVNFIVLRSFREYTMSRNLYLDLLLRTSITSFICRSLLKAMHISFGRNTENVVTCIVKVIKRVFLRQYYNIVVEYNISAILLPLLQENIINLIHEKHILRVQNLQKNLLWPMSQRNHI